MSKRDFDELTEREKQFILKEWENKVVFDSTMERNAVLNAQINANRKRNARFVELHKKKQAKADREFNQQAQKTVAEMEKEGGKRWVDAIYAANGLKRPTKERGSSHG
ncbi:phenylalanine racemase [Listeria monocytogenes]|nr:phenylalanine racemase [Listeria monocytogenes]